MPDGRRTWYRLADPHLAQALSELGSASVVADSKQTLMCSYLSAVLLAGLVLNSTLGWWWADPIAALAIASFAVREGVEAWRGDGR